MRIEACGHRFDLVDAAPERAPEHARLLGRHAALFGELSTTASIFAVADGHLVDLGEFGAFRAGEPDVASIRILRWPARASLRDEFVYGPVLLSALAARRIFALHASAFRLDGADGPALAVVAPSGTGKSTLARAALELGWERLADDLLPTTCGVAEAPLLHPHFPQLKLPADQQYPRQRPAHVPLRALVVLERGSATEISTLDPGNLMHTVLSNTISSRLFPPQVLHDHLGFAGAMAAAAVRGTLQVLRLRVREDRDVPAATAEALSRLEARLGARGVPA